MCDSFSFNKMTIFINIAPIKFLSKSFTSHILKYCHFVIQIFKILNFWPCATYFPSIKWRFSSTSPLSIFAVRRDISHKMTPCSNRDPFDQVVKEAGLNPDVMGSNPMTSRFFGRGILCVDKIGSPANPQQAVGR